MVSQHYYHLKKKINYEINIITDLKLNALNKDILIFKNSDLLSMNKNLTKIQTKKKITLENFQMIILIKIKTKKKNNMKLILENFLMKKMIKTRTKMKIKFKIILENFQM